MIRLTNNQARTLGALALIAPIPADIHQQITRLYQQGQIGNDVYRALMSPEQGSVPLDDVSQIYDLLIAASRNERDGTKEVLDLVIEMMKHPLAANMVTTDWIFLLRQKLLSKEEDNKRIQWGDKLLRCNSCGHSFDVDGEEAVLIHDGNALALQCRSCRKPRFTSCKTRGCDESVDWSGNNKTTYCLKCIEKLKTAKSHLKPLRGGDFSIDLEAPVFAPINFLEDEE